MKTGGTTLAFDLARDFAPDVVYPGEADRRNAGDVEPYISVSQLVRSAAARTAEIRLYAGHFAYVVCELLPVRVRSFTLLRDPVARTVSVLRHFKHRFERYDVLSLEQIYDDEFVFEHFVHDHQTKLFSATPQDQIETFASRLTHEENLARHRGLVPAGATATFPVDAARLARAKANLAAVEVVGVTEHYPDFVEELRARFGWWPAGVNTDARTNVSSTEWRAPPALLRRIEHDNAFDMELYDFARVLAEPQAGPRSTGAA